MIDTAPFDDSTRWRIAQAKDRRFDGAFVTCVTSTGIYCRPSCPARIPKRENVVFHATPAAAEAAGFRPCLRCRPEAVSNEEAAVAAVIAALRGSEGEIPTLAELAALTGYAPGHVQRLFKRAVGLSPAAYGRALRRERAHAVAASGAGLTETIYAAGYGAPSRFYHEHSERLGMSASAWVAGGRGVTIRWARIETSLGPMLLAATERGVCRLSFETDPADLSRRFPHAVLAEGGPDFTHLVNQVVAAVEEPGQSRSIPLDVRGTAFQEAVWNALQAIPAGETRSYAELAAAAGFPAAIRAAGNANGANPVAVLIPCHRVVRSDGSLGGYAHGPEIKAEMLRRERV